MAYAVTNQPKLLNQTLGGTTKLWIYKTTDAHATVDASGYFTDGYDLGMRQDDIVIVIDTNLAIASSHSVDVSGTTINLADGTVIGSTTNTD